MRHFYSIVILSLSILALPASAQLSIDAATANFNAYVAQMQAQTANIAAQQEAAQATLQKQLQAQMAIQLLFQYCPLMLKQQVAPMPQAPKLKKTSYQVMDAAWKAREDEGYVYEKDVDLDLSKEIGKDASGKFAQCCDQFMNKDGKMGPWGSWALQLIKDKPESFGQKVPDDITKWCPNYPKMNKNQRELFWVWTMMSMASSESTCNPKSDNPNAPNGTAIGLFQLEGRVCPSARDLHNPNENISCAVNLLAKELENRDTLMTPTSKGQEGTYWGTIRSDDWNKKRGGDIQGAKKTRELMKQYRYCQSSSMGPATPASAPAAKK